MHPFVEQQVVMSAHQRRVETTNILSGWLSIQYLVPDSVHLVSCLQCQQTGLLNLNTGLCNIIQDSALFCKRLPKRNSLLDLYR